MMNDPIVEELHQVRERIWVECGGDLEGLIRRLREADSKNKDRLVTVEDVQKRSRPPKEQV